MKIRYDGREDRLVLFMAGSGEGARTLLLTRRLWLQWVRAMSEAVTKETLNSPPIKQSKKPSENEIGHPPILVDAIRLRKLASEKQRMGFVCGKEVVTLNMRDAELTQLLSIMVGLGKGAGWDLDAALSRMGPRHSSIAPPANLN